MNETINARILRFAKEKHIGQRVLAKAVGIAQSNLSVALRNERVWNEEQLGRFALVLGVSKAELARASTSLLALPLWNDTFIPDKPRFGIGDKIINAKGDTIGYLLAVATDPQGRRYAFFFNEADPTYSVVDETCEPVDEDLAERIGLDLFVEGRKAFAWAHMPDVIIQRVIQMLEVAVMLNEMENVTSEVNEDGFRMYDIKKNPIIGESGNMTEKDWDTVFIRRESGETWNSIWNDLGPNPRRKGQRLYKTPTSLTATAIHIKRRRKRDAKIHA